MIDYKKIQVESRTFKWCHLDNQSGMAGLLEGPLEKATRYNHRDDWAGGSWQEAIDRARAGEQSRVALSDAFLEKVESMTRMETSQFQNVAAVAGGAVNVPAMLSGTPVTMRQRRRVMAQVHPVVVLADCFASAGVSVDAISRRGAAILALVRALSAIRPVTLVAQCALGGPNTLHSFRIETAPLDLARAAWALGSPQVLRCHFHAQAGNLAGRANCYEGGYPVDGSNDALAAALGFDEYIATGRLVGGDPAWEDDDAAAAWVQETLAANTPDTLAA